MNEFEEKLNAILSDPGEMEKISRLAADLMGGGETSAPAPQPGALPNMDGELLGKITKLLGSAGGRSDKTALLQALAPYLRPERQARLQKALRLAQMAKIATAALEGYGGDRGV